MARAGLKDSCDTFLKTHKFRHFIIHQLLSSKGLLMGSKPAVASCLLTDAMTASLLVSMEWSSGYWALNDTEAANPLSAKDIWPDPAVLLGIPAISEAVPTAVLPLCPAAAASFSASDSFCRSCFMVLSMALVASMPCVYTLILYLSAILGLQMLGISAPAV